MSDEGIHGEVSSASVLMDDDDQEIPLQAEAKCVYISKEGVLQQALEKISLGIHEIRTCAIGRDHIIASVCINAPPHGRYSMLHQKRIFGDYKLTAEDALESAKLATLLHLQKIDAVYVDDINRAELMVCEAKLAACEKKLMTASNWSDIFQEETECLKAKLDNAYKENEKLIAAARMVAVKKEELIPQETNIKQEPSVAQTSTPPSSSHHTDARFLQHKKRTISHETVVKRTLFTKVLPNDCKSQTIKAEKENT